MASPPWIRLGGHVLVTPDGAGKARGTGLATCLRDLAAAEARRIRRERTRGQSCQVAAYAAGSPESRASFADWGTPTARVAP